MVLKEKYSLDELAIVPSISSKINSRMECSVFTDKSMLPLAVAPMDTVIDEHNFHLFCESSLLTVLPRNIWKKINPNKYIKYNYNLYISISLNEIDEIISGTHKNYNKWNKTVNKYNFHIDIANGHMELLRKKLNDLRTHLIYQDNKVSFMIGNIANPYTIELFNNLNVDYVKLGIGSGSACLTSAKTPIHYPMASLIAETKDVIALNQLDIKIIADGGIKNTRDITLCLALGADYVMSGSLFNKCEEACSDVYYCVGIDKYVNEKDAIVEPKKSLYKFDNGTTLLHNVYNVSKDETKDKYHLYRGMSTVEVQKDQKKKNIRISEGLSKYNKVEWTLEEFLDEVQHSLRSTMSYCNAYNLNQLKQKASFIKMNKIPHNTLQ